MSAIAAPCPCSLVAAAERLLGKLSDGDRELLEEMDAADANAPMFEPHMVFEEDVIGRHMKPGDFHKLKAGHAFIRRYRAHNLIVPAAFVRAHAEWEKTIFPTIGASGYAPKLAV